MQEVVHEDTHLELDPLTDYSQCRMSRIVVDGVIFPFTDDQPCCSVEDCFEADADERRKRQPVRYPVAVIYPADNQGVHQNRRGFRRQGPSDRTQLPVETRLARRLT